MLRYTYCIAGGQIRGARENQEDSFRLFPDVADETEVSAGYAVLADGMGGAQDGELASRVVAESAISSLRRAPLSLRGVAEQANDDIRFSKQQREMDEGAGSTMIAVRFSDGRLEWVSVGDSLLFLYRHGELRPLNEKHVLGLLLDQRAERGEITWEEAKNDTDRQALYCAVCGDTLEAIDAPEGIELQDRDRIVISSDGLLTLRNRGIEEVLATHESCSPARTVAALLQSVQAIGNPRQDNTTVIILDCLCKEAPKLPCPTKTVERTQMLTTGSPRYAMEAESLLGDREEQQDRYFHAQNADAALAVVADGAGGSLGGAMAAQIAVDAAAELWRQELSAAPNCQQAARILAAFIVSTHHKVVREARVAGARASGKAAIVILYSCGGEICVANVGDCRAYMLTKRKWHRLSIDDSLLALQLRAGTISEEEAWGHPDQSRLTQALGAESEPQPHVSIHAVAAHTSFLLCCDGLWSQLRPQKWMYAPVYSPFYGPRTVLKRWMQEALEAKDGDSDNITAIFIAPSAGMFARMAENPLRPHFRARLSLIIVGAVLGIALTGAALMNGSIRTLLTLPQQGSAAETQCPNAGEGKAPAPQMPPSHAEPSVPAQEPDVLPVNPAQTGEPTGEQTPDAAQADKSPGPNTDKPDPRQNGSESGAEQTPTPSPLQEPGSPGDAVSSAPHAPVPPHDRAQQTPSNQRPSEEMPSNGKTEQSDPNKAPAAPSPSDEEAAAPVVETPDDWLQKAKQHVCENQTERAVEAALIAARRCDIEDRKVQHEAHELLLQYFKQGKLKEDYLLKHKDYTEAAYWIACIHRQAGLMDVRAWLEKAAADTHPCPWAQYAWGKELIRTAQTDEGKKKLRLAQERDVRDYDEAMKMLLKSRKRR